MNPLPLLALASSLVRPAARRLARTVAGLALLVAALGLPAARAQIYVVDGSLNGGGGGVSAFAQGSNGNVLPDAIVTGAGTGFISPSATVANATHLYVLGNNFGEPPFVLKFSLPTAGNATPVSKTFLAPSAGILSFFTALAIDGSNLYVLDNGTGGAAVGAVEVYPLANLTANTSGSPLSATRTITGAATGLNRPNGVAVDGTSVYVANNLGNNVLVFALAATGNAAPTANITGAALNGPSSVAVDATTIYVLNFGSSRVTTYPTSANGNVAPSTTIGSTSLTTGAYYIGVDATTVYVGDQGDPFAVPVLPPAVRAFPKATNSTTATPSTTISGTTALNSINGFFVLAPPGTAAPNVTASGGSTAFTVGAGAVVADAALTLTAVPATLATATIQLTTNFQTAQDVLAFTNTSSTTFGNIAGTYNATLGLIRLESVGATATKAQWQSALRAVTYNNTAGSPNTANRTVTTKVFDGTQTSSTATKTVTISAAATAPGAPTIGTATAGNAQATVTFTAPVSNGGSAITGYTVTSSPAGGTDSNAGSTGLSHVITGLTNGTAYTFTVTATNVIGTGAASGASNSVTPITVPGAPTIGTVTRGNAQATVTFTAPASTGGSAITGYTVTSSPAGGTDSNAGTTGLSHIITGLTNGTAYTFTVTATNAAGAGAASGASSSITPATVPGAPMIGTATAGTAQATVTFTAPVSNGGSAITGYTVTSSPAGGTDSNAGSTSLSHVVTGLAPGTPYTFTVTATNAIGTGAASAASNSATPVAAPTIASVMAPAIGTYKAGDVLTFTVNYSSAVTITGTPTLALTLGSAPRTAAYVASASSTTALVFRYTVALGDNAAGGIALTSPLVLGTGGAITGAGSLAAALTFTPPSTTTVIVSTAPILTASSGAAAFTSADNATSTPVVVDGGITLVDPSLAALPTTGYALVTITGNYQSATDILGFANTSAATFGDIAGSFQADLSFLGPAGTLFLYSPAGTATIAQLQAALRAVTYTSSAAVPNTANRTVSFTVNDGVQASNTVTKTVTVTATNQSPILATSTGSTSYGAGATAVAVDAGLTATDRDSTLASALITITGIQAGVEFVAFTNTGASTGNIASRYATLGGVPTLILESAGSTATLVQWQAALRAVTYFANASAAVGDRIVTFQASDGITASAVVTKTVALRRQPVIAWSPAGLTVGSALGSAQLNATATFDGSLVAGAFAYTPAAGTVPAFGTQTLSATFVPTDPATYLTATGTASLAVSPAPTTVALSGATATFNSAGQSVTLTATVTGVAGTVSAGTVTFTVVTATGTALGTAVTSGTVTNGTAAAAYTLPAGTAAGTYTVQAAYNGAGAFASGSGTGSLTVGPAATTVVATGASGATPNVFALEATVTSAAGAVNTGTVTFTLVDNAGKVVGTAVISAAVVNGKAAVSYPVPAGTAPGSYNVRAVYNAAGSFVGSNGTSTAPVIVATPTTLAASGEFTYKTRVSTFAKGFQSPRSLAFDKEGNLYVANSVGSTVSKVSSDGKTVSLFASGFTNPASLAFDAAGNLYVGDIGSSTVSKVSPDGKTVSQFASGVGLPVALAFDKQGNLYVANFGESVVSKVSSDGKTVSQFASGFDFPIGLAFDTAGNLYVANSVGSTVSKVSSDGKTVSLFASGFDSPASLAFDAAGNLYVANYGKSFIDYLRKIVASTVSKVSSDGKTVSRFVSDISSPYSLAFDRAGSLYVGSPDSNLVSKITQTSVVNLTAKVTATTGTVNSGTVTFTLLGNDASKTVVGTPVTSATVTAGTVSVNYPIPAGVSNPPYTIQAVYNPGAGFAGSSDRSQTLSPTVAQILQIFFGGFSSPAGAASVKGESGRSARAATTAGPSTLAAVLDPNGTTGKLVGYLDGIKAGFSVDIAINDDDSFTGQTQALTSSTGTGRTLTFSGRIASGVMTGTVAELGLTFTANVDAAAGSSQASAGLYKATAANGTTTYSVIGTQGQVFALAVTPGGVAAGTGTVSATGAYTVATAQGTAIAGTVNAGTGVTTATLTLANGSTIGVTGLSSAVVPTSRFAGLAVRAAVGGGQVITQGFAISGPKTVLARAIGPGLAQFGVSGVLQTPTLTLFDDKGRVIQSNNGWAGDSALAAAFSQVGAFPLAPNSRDAAAIVDLPAGAYTLQVTGGVGAGQALAEIYDLGASRTSPIAFGDLIGLSSLGQAGGSTVLVAGLVVDGNTPRRVIIRGIGPSLGQFGVSNPLATPLLRLYDGTQTVIAQNQAWGTPVPITAAQPAATASEVAAAAAAAGAFPLAAGSADSSLVVTLAPGAYTVHLTGANNSSGTGLIEIYEVK